MIIIIFFENMVINAFLACLFNVHYLIFLFMVMSMHIFMNIFRNRSIALTNLYVYVYVRIRLYSRSVQSFQSHHRQCLDDQ